MTTVIANTTIVTGDAGRTVLHHAGIAISEDRIVSVGPTDAVQQAHPGAEVVDGGGKAVFPGLINCHTHLLATGDRGILEDFGFPTRLTFPVSARSLLSQEERQTLALLGALESIPQRRYVPAGNFLGRGRLRSRPGSNGPPAGAGRKHQRRGRSPGPERGVPFRRSSGATPGYSAARTWLSPGMVGIKGGSTASWRPTLPKLALRRCYVAAATWPKATASAIPSTFPRAAKRLKR